MRKKPDSQKVISPGMIGQFGGHNLHSAIIFVTQDCFAVTLVRTVDVIQKMS